MPWVTLYSSIERFTFRTTRLVKSTFQRLKIFGFWCKIVEGVKKIGLDMVGSILPGSFLLSLLRGDLLTAVMCSLLFCLRVTSWILSYEKSVGARVRNNHNVLSSCNLQAIKFCSTLLYWDYPSGPSQGLAIRYYFLPGHFLCFPAGLRTGIKHYQLVRPTKFKY